MNEENKLSIYAENTGAIVDIRDKMESEIQALRATNNENAVAIAQDVQLVLENLLGVATMRTRGLETDGGKITELLGRYLRYLQIVLSGGILTPLTGREEEWEDVRAPEGEERKLVCRYNGRDYPIEYKSVQVNRRYQNIFRFNKDNKYAHRVDMIRYVDQNDPRKVIVNRSSLRFIKFPYTLEQINCPVTLDQNNQIVSYANGATEESIQNQVAFFSGDGQAIAAPPVPFYVLKREGIDYQEEIRELVKSSMKVVE